MGNRATRNPMRNKTAMRLWSGVLAELIVTEERRQWILENYPPEKQGRPLLFAPSSQDRKKKRKDAPAGEENGRREMEMAA